MQYRILGKTGLKVSAVGFGGIPIQRIDARGTRALMERLVEKGVNYIDTARGYTVSESYLGEALSGGLREKFILATKSMSRGYADMARGHRHQPEQPEGRIYRPVSAAQYKV